MILVFHYFGDYFVDIFSKSWRSRPIGYSWNGFCVHCLDCQLYQRSADIALGVPFNIASYALLLSMVAHECGLIPGVFVHTLGDAHIYLNHVEGLKEQLQRTPKKLPHLELANKKTLDYVFEDIKLVGYTHDPFIKFPIAV